MSTIESPQPQIDKEYPHIDSLEWSPWMRTGGGVVFVVREGNGELEIADQATHSLNAESRVQMLGPIEFRVKGSFSYEFVPIEQ